MSWLPPSFLTQVIAVKVGKEDSMLAVIGAVLIVLWLLGFLAFHVTLGFIHILLVIVLVLVVMHFIRGGSATT
jgi:Family of unknown function (DUF5670)